jgi:hypothetical protein
MHTPLDHPVGTVDHSLLSKDRSGSSSRLAFTPATVNARMMLANANENSVRIP